MNLSRLHATFLTFKNHLNDTFYAYTKILLRKPVVSNPVIDQSKPSRSKLRLKEILEASFYTFCVVSTFINHVGYPAQIYGMSMQPEFNELQIKNRYSNHANNSYLRLDLDHVWVNCWKARNFEFSRGDIVVFVSPKDPYEYVIKRIIALEGDTVETNKGNLIKIKVPEGHCWVEGDNWGNSVDSNKYGPIPMGLIFGIATRVIWPAHKQRLLGGGIPDHLLPERVTPEQEDQVIIRPKSFWQQLKILLYFMNPSEGKSADG